VTVVRGRWFPARVEAGGQRWRRAYVVAAEGGEHDGLWVWSQPDVVAFHRRIDWAAADIPVHARGELAVPLVDGGTATVFVGSGCRCGALGKWGGPVWATSLAVKR
jgi:hypothetical protein